MMDAERKATLPCYFPGTIGLARNGRSVFSEGLASQHPRRLILLGITLVTALSASAGAPTSATLQSHKITFNQHIRPILSDACFHCHGFDAHQRQAGLRLDTAEGATHSREGRQAIVPGNLEASELWRRVSSQDPSLRMPPPDSGKQLTSQQVALLGEWIKQGAAYQKHWSFEPPRPPSVPDAGPPNWARNAIDKFVAAVLDLQKLTPRPQAPKERLLRRVTLDLTGLPPTPAEVDQFLADQRHDAYEHWVDRLLASPRYGEHMARYWLDAARYGDTHGLHLDNERSMWPYRDWVVRAFNQNLPFDQFTLWQLAGDLLPDSTREQQIASGFNRCNVTTSEGGAIDEEFHVRYAIDRVETTSTIWMGLTMGCAVCHDHKLDPITQKEFFEVFAIFNNMAEKAMDGNALLPDPVLKLPTEAHQQKLKALEADIETNRLALQTAAKSFDYTDPASATSNAPAVRADLVWFDDDFPTGADSQVSDPNHPIRWSTASDGKVHKGNRSLLRQGAGLHQVFFTQKQTPLVVQEEDRLFAHVYLDPSDPPKALMLQFHIDGNWSRRANWGDEDLITFGTKGTPEKMQLGSLPQQGSWVRLEVDPSRLNIKPGTRITGLAFTQFGGTIWWDNAGIHTTNDPACDPGQSLLAWDKSVRDQSDTGGIPADLRPLVKKQPEERSPEEREKIRLYYLENVFTGGGDGLVALRQKRRALREAREAVERDIPATMVSRELEKPRPAHILIRGEYDKKGEPVGPGVPSILPPLPASETTNRLTFARWLVDPGHPLTARVTVNRLWQQFFGTGIVRTSEDFGTKGEWPAHPELLDWLATDFIRSGWNVKSLVRSIVTSAAYRQDSSVDPKTLAVDPENRLISRGPRLRMDAEMVRDNALFVSGLLKETMGGRGVRPYQPAGIWEAVGYTTSNTAKYSQDQDEALYRRSLYTFWKRTAPPPNMTTFDAPSREQCRVRRERTNTPLQALVTMNDTQFFEAARHLGHRMLSSAASDQERLRLGFRLVTSRSPSPSEEQILSRSLAAQRALYNADPDLATKAVSVGDSPAPKDIPHPELAAYAMVANLLLNLDEVLTKN